MNVATSDIPAEQLHALYRLHSGMNVNKGLIDLQLAATHISFMLQQQSEENVRYKHLLPVSALYSIYQSFLRLFPIFLEHFINSKR